MKAIKIKSKNNAQVVTDAKKPELRPDYLLVKTYAVALNPTDWKHITFVDAEVTSGCDFAGVVEEVGPEVTKSFKKGDRVYGVIHGANQSQPESGAFAEYLITKGDLTLKMPDGMDFTDAASLGMGICTVGQGLFQALQLPMPDQPTKEKFPVLIYGGSSAMGAYGIQFAVAAGLEVVTTASKHNHEYVKSLGATSVFDYRDENVGAEIRRATGNKLCYAWDAISEHDSPRICGDALASPAPDGKELKYASVLRVKVDRSDVHSEAKLMYTIYGESFYKAAFGAKETPASEEDYEFMKKFVAISEKLVADGKIKPHNVDVRDGGLDGVLKGLEDMKNGKVSANKLVYKVV